MELITDRAVDDTSLESGISVAEGYCRVHDDGSMPAVSRLFGFRKAESCHCLAV